MFKQILKSETLRFLAAVILFLLFVHFCACSKLPVNPIEIREIPIHDTTIVIIDTSRVDTVYIDTTKVDTFQVTKPIEISIFDGFHLRADKSDSEKTHQTIVEIEEEGLYQVYVKAFFNSGISQKNESAFLTVNSHCPIDGDPFVVIQDTNDETRLKEVMYGGAFYFEKGLNVIETSHYCLISSIYPEFLNGRMIGAESIYIEGFVLVK